MEFSNKNDGKNNKIFDDVIKNMEEFEKVSSHIIIPCWKIDLEIDDPSFNDPEDRVRIIALHFAKCEVISRFGNAKI